MTLKTEVELKNENCEKLLDFRSSTIQLHNLHMHSSLRLEISAIYFLDLIL